ncbi:hypothetical protein SAMN03080594_109171 [Arenibacter palladensis]|uniref:Uncharacterized protein n=1 Tax=Arenibacter palladensis TaxID=237373 RepID=A0A1M5FR25_9FLAO|nr:hypothetical protein SAMN03080594_109171 [Arenibacter palladensis]
MGQVLQLEMENKLHFCLFNLLFSLFIHKRECERVN